MTKRKLKTNSDIAANLDPLRPIPNVPLKFPQPMFAPLRDLFQDMLIPGLDRIPNNSLLGLPINAAFIEAYMVGLNHEMTRELLWREFPTHLDNTFFSQFWDLGGNADTSSDLEEIKDWSGQLGGNLQPGRGNNLFILLIKGDLLLRYPNAVIYAQRAGFNVGGGATSIPQVDTAVPAVFPVMRINPAPGNKRFWVLILVLCQIKFQVAIRDGFSLLRNTPQRPVLD